VQVKIEEVEGEIKQLRNDKPDGWREEVAALRLEKQQLRRKEELLLQERVERLRLLGKEE